MGGRPGLEALGSFVIWAALVLALAPTAWARDPTKVNPEYPRIANCYGSGIGWMTWEQGAEYWSKLDLFIGGGYDLHYDWEHPRWTDVLRRIEENVARLWQVNPNALVLPYVDVVEGPDNPTIPEHWWSLRDGQRWSGWPGYYRINVDLKEVLEFNWAKVAEEVFNRECFDGVFYDCWHPDSFLVPKTAALRGGKAIVMVNDWNLPGRGFETLNGCLAEDEVNRIIEGRVDFQDFMERYLRWCGKSRRPVVTTIVCHPRSLEMDPWYWDKMSWQERQQTAESLRTSDLQTMRFGLTTTLMGDGYFGYDCANLGRGQRWWYPEYDAPLGRPLGPARRRADGLWERTFEGGIVVVNGTDYDAVVEMDGKYRDFSSGRVGRRFVVRMYDGKILVPTEEPETTQAEAPPRITMAPPRTVRLVELDDGITAVATPGGLDLRFGPKGDLQRILLGGRRVMTGGWPVAVAQPWREFAAQQVSRQQSTTGAQATLHFRGALVQENQRVEFAEECRVDDQNHFVLRFVFEAKTDLNLRMWRHYFFFPVREYAGASVETDTTSLTLPGQPEKTELASNLRRLRVETAEAVVEVQSSVPASLVDHRAWGTEDYLLAAYPVGGAVAGGTSWHYEVEVWVRTRRHQPP